MSKQIFATINFIVDKEKTSTFFPILQQGVKVPAKVGCSLKSMLCDQFGVTPEYLSDRIKTIFLNGKPVDDFDSAIIFDNAVIALSAAMPGLVGATFRSGGPLSAFRSSITHMAEDDKLDASGTGMVILKFFNLLISEMGPAFLERGVFIKAGIIKDLIEETKEKQESFFKSVKIDGNEISSGKLTDLKWNDRMELIHLTVKIENINH